MRKDGFLGVYEAYYDNHGNVISTTVDPVSPVYEELVELRTNLELMLESLDKSIVDYEEIGSGRRIDDRQN